MPNLPNDPFTAIPATPSPNADLPASAFPSLPRINITELVGPPVANRQDQANEKRTETLRADVNLIIAFLNVLDTKLLRKDNTAAKDGFTGPTADISWNGKKLTSLAAGAASGDGINKGQLDGLNTTLSAVDASLQAQINALSGQFAGAIVAFAGITPPSGYLECQGQVLLIGDFPALGAALGATWGGDGITTFGVPDFRGRTLIGRGQGAGLTLRAFAAMLGEESHQLTLPELASHFHIVRTGPFGSNNQVLPNDESGRFGTFQISNTQIHSSTEGGDTPHNNMQPSAAIKWLIKT